MSHLPLNALNAFKYVYETGGIRAAARQLQVSHSAVSRHVQELEAWLGLALIDPKREGRLLKFTTAGDSLGHSVQETLSQLAFDVAKLKEAPVSNSIVISTTPSFASRWLLPRLTNFTTEHPNIEIHIRAEQQIEKLRDNQYDLAIRMGAGPWEGDDAFSLMDERLVPVCNADLYRKIKEQGLSDTDIYSKFPLIHDRDPSTSWLSWAHEFLPNAGVQTFQKGARYSSSDLVLRAAASGLGIALARERLAEEDLDLGMLHRIYDDRFIHMSSAYSIITKPRHHRSKALGLVVDWLKKEAET